MKRLAGASAGLFVLACQPAAPAGPTAAPAKPTEAPKPAAPAAPAASPAAAPAAPAASPAAQAAPASKVALAPVKIGLQSNVLALPTKVAVESDSFSKYGLKVEDIKFEAGGSIVRDAIVAGQVQAGTFFAAAFVVGAATGRVAAYMAGHNAARASHIVAREGLKTWADLKGKKFGGGRGASTNQILENKILPAEGFGKSDYTWVSLGTGGAEALGAMIAGQIDAFANVDPHTTMAVKMHKANLVADYTKYDPMPIIVAGPTSFAEQNPESVVALIKGWRDMAKFWQENPQKVFDISKAFLAGSAENIDDDILKASIEHLDVKPNLDKATMEPYFKETADLLLQVDNIKQLPDFSKTVRYDLYEQAAKA